MQELQGGNLSGQRIEGDPRGAGCTARYFVLGAKEQAALSPRDVERYRAHRAEFDAEVEQHKAHAREHGWIDVGLIGRVVRFNVPVELLPARRT